LKETFRLQNCSQEGWFTAASLAAGDIYGVMSFGVAQRTDEFGIRIPLGERRSRVIGLVLNE
jgi:ABC-type antimicrobial peptide transport system permease subunit